MLSEDHESSEIRKGRLIGPEPFDPIREVVHFLENQLIGFSQKYANSRIKNEKGLTQRLCNFLQIKAQDLCYPFFFDKEHIEEPEKGKSPQVDIGVIASSSQGITIESKSYSQEESFFSLEAKRLCKLSKSREKEYLVGRKEKGKYRDCGGVERFKKGIHGKRLEYSALIGYVQENDFAYWYKKINGWVDELIAAEGVMLIQWTKEDKLKKEYTGIFTAKYLSKNSRDSDYITLYHLWVKLAKTK